MMTRLRLTSLSLAAGLALGLTGCASWFSGSSSKPEPTPLAPMQQSLVPLKTQWTASVGDAEGYAFRPAYDGTRIFAADASGRVSIVDAATGRDAGRVDFKAPLTAGVTVQDGRLLATTRQGELVSITTSGEPRWKVRLSSQALETPQTDGKTVIVRTVDGHVTAFDFASGQQLWVYLRPQPALTVRSSGNTALVGSEVVLVGESGGKLSVLNLASGDLLWDANVALAHGATEIDRVVDVASPPVFDRGQICAVAYQGRLTCFDARSAAPMWSREVSSSRPLALDAANVYVTSEDGTVWAFSRTDGKTVWQQPGLKWRTVSGPAMLGRFVVVTDGEGWAHLLSNESGDLLARTRTGVTGEPVAAGNALVVQGDGRLAQLGL